MAIALVLKLLILALSVPILSVPADFKPRVTNHIQNGGFETGKLSPWKFVRVYGRNKAVYSITKPGLTGSGGHYKFEYDARTVYDPGLEGPEAGFGILQNATGLVKGTKYYIAFTYINAPKGDAGYTETKLYVEVGPSNWRDTFAPKYKLTTFKKTFVASKTRELVGIYFYSNPYYSYDNSQHSQIDGIKIYKA